MNHTISKLTVSALLAASCGLATADTQTNTMTSIATFNDACDLVAIGIDFGINPAGTVPAAGYVSFIGNTSAGNTTTTHNSTNHGELAEDGGTNASDGHAADDDKLTLSLSPAPLAAALNTALSAVNLDVSGVYVACSLNPISIAVAADTTAVNLPVGASVAPVTGYESTLTPSSVPDGATGSINYTAAFAGATIPSVANTTPFTALWVKTGTITAGQSVNPGHYADINTVTLTF